MVSFCYGVFVIEHRNVRRVKDIFVYMHMLKTYKILNERQAVTQIIKDRSTFSSNSLYTIPFSHIIEAKHVCFHKHVKDLSVEARFVLSIITSRSDDA